jgi:peptidoglycan hydrolase-like protein with peptidoglycan-binding domain
MAIAFLRGTVAMPLSRHRGTLKEEGMTRKLALAAGVLFAAVSAGTLSAQASTNSKPTSSTSTMQHARAGTPKRQDSTSVGATASASSTKVHHAAWTRQQVQEAQQGLGKAGFYKGTPNGKLDRQTRKAIRAYQKSNKLPVTGRLNNDLLSRLRSS